MCGFANFQSTCDRLVQSEMNFNGAVQSGKTTRYPFGYKGTECCSHGQCGLFILSTACDREVTLKGSNIFRIT